MYQSRRGSTLNSNGYTLLEALFQLVVLVLFAQFLVFIFVWISGQNHFLANENVAWEVFINDFQQYLNNVEEISKLDRNGGIAIKQTHSKNTYQISQSSDVVRLQINNTGNIPMLIGVKKSTFSISENDLTINVELQNGSVKERTFFVQFAQ